MAIEWAAEQEDERAHLTRSSDEWRPGTRPTLPRITGPIGGSEAARSARGHRRCYSAIRGITAKSASLPSGANSKPGGSTDSGKRAR
jgi:hypothetical protein